LAAATTVIDRVMSPEAAYSFVGEVSNQTNYTLTLTESETNGTWETKPPAVLAAGGSPKFSTHYDGFNHTGKVVYSVVGGEGSLTMEWSIPLFGNNTISDSTSISGTAASHEGGRGWHAFVWYYLKEA